MNKRPGGQLYNREIEIVINGINISIDTLEMPISIIDNTYCLYIPGHGLYTSIDGLEFYKCDVV